MPPPWLTSASGAADRCRGAAGGRVDVRGEVRLRPARDGEAVDGVVRLLLPCAGLQDRHDCGVGDGVRAGHVGQAVDQADPVRPTRRVGVETETVEPRALHVGVVGQEAAGSHTLELHLPGQDDVLEDVARRVVLRRGRRPDQHHGLHAEPVGQRCGVEGVLQCVVVLDVRVVGDVVRPDERLAGRPVHGEDDRVVGGRARAPTPRCRMLTPLVDVRPTPLVTARRYCPTESDGSRTVIEVSVQLV